MIETDSEHRQGCLGASRFSVMIFTLNEEIHLPSCLQSLNSCDDVIVVDSFSSDRTASICAETGVRFFQHEFSGFGTQRNWALAHCEPRHDWVLVLDADERATPELIAEINDALSNVPKGVAAFRLRRRLYMWGRWLRFSSLYPTWVVRLVHRKRVHYVNRGHAETQVVDGVILDLMKDLIDENLKSLGAWFERQNRYASREAEWELERDEVSFDLSGLIGLDPFRRREALKRLAARLPARGLLYFVYCYVLRGGFLDGRDGFTFCCMKAIYQQMVSIKKYDFMRRRYLRRTSDSNDESSACTKS